MIMQKKFVTYYRVSTQKQGVKGLGMEAQKSMCESYIKSVNGVEITSFKEVKSGKECNRIELNKAIDECKLTGATLLVAKLDRLSREVEFIFNLKNSGIDFVCSDMPDFNTLTLGIFATIAQYERELISDRTKKALDVKRKQGFKFGNPQVINPTTVSNPETNNSLKVRQENAFEDDNNKKAGALIVALRNGGATWINIVSELNSKGFKARRGGEFSIMQAQRLYKRYNALG